MNSLLTGKRLGLLGASLVAATASVNADGIQGAVYTMDNAAASNHVLAWKRADNGTLSGLTTVATGGAGTGAGLSSQGSLLLNGRWLFVCNAGSDEVSVLAASPAGLQLVDKVSSGGRMPLSLALQDDLLYVLNAGGLVGDKDNITAFRFGDGNLVPVPNSTRALSGDNTGPAQVSFTKDGSVLVVTERTTSLIDTFTIGWDGLAGIRKTFQSAGVTPFGFAPGRSERIFVSEAGGGSAPSSASSYTVSEEGDLAVISAAVPTQQKAACWLITSRDGHFAYTANAGSGSISGYSVSSTGALQLLDPDGITATTGTGSHPVDMTLSSDGLFLISQNNGNGTLLVFQTSRNGSLAPIGGVNGIPASAAGLVAR
jgi:6-phosphogluconolactonase (cycloisomerase 2 family)